MSNDWAEKEAREWNRAHGKVRLSQHGPTIGHWVCLCGADLGDCPIDEVEEVAMAHAESDLAALLRRVVERQREEWEKPLLALVEKFRKTSKLLEPIDWGHPPAAQEGSNAYKACADDLAAAIRKAERQRVTDEQFRAIAKELGDNGYCSYVAVEDVLRKHLPAAAIGKGEK